MYPSMQEYDLVVIGSGPGGQKAAIAAAKLGKTVAIVERDQMLGGVCTNTGTIPSKTLREAVLYLTGITQRELYGATASKKTSPPPTCWPAPSTSLTRTGKWCAPS
jgi:NAD(P) transhydrogenase